MFFEVAPDDIDIMIGYMNDLIGDFWPFILVILGLSLGIMIIRAIFKL